MSMILDIIIQQHYQISLLLQDYFGDIICLKLIAKKKYQIKITGPQHTKHLNLLRTIIHQSKSDLLKLKALCLTTI